MSRLQFSAAEQADIEVDLWGTIFVRVPLTRKRKREFIEGQATLDSIEAQAAQKQRDLDPLDPGFAAAAADVELDAEADAVKTTAAMLDVLLAPADPDVATKPSDLIVAKYDEDGITFEDLEQFVSRVGEAAQRPPTSPRTSNES